MPRSRLAKRQAKIAGVPRSRDFQQQEGRPPASSGRQQTLMGADQRGIAIYRFVCGEGNGPTLCTDEPRDLYDLWFLMVEAGVDLSRLVGAIAEKLCFRQKDIAGIEDRILKKEQRLKALWTGRLGHQIEALPEFDAVFRAVRRELQAGIAG